MAGFLLKGRLALRICRSAALACLTITITSSHPASGEEALQGVALIIGNGDYEHLEKLPNPANDTRHRGNAGRAGLRDDTDRNARRLKRDLDTFAEDAEGADVAILDYSGNGIEAGGRNYLVPADAGISWLGAAADELVALSGTVDALRAGS